MPDEVVNKNPPNVCAFDDQPAESESGLPPVAVVRKVTPPAEEFAGVDLEGNGAPASTSE